MGPEGRVPRNWDQIREPDPDLDREPRQALPADEIQRPPPLSMAGGAWGDLVVALAVCTTAFVALAVLGYGAELALFPWALALAILWWAAAAAVLLVIRQGTPGMLMAGVVFEDPVPRHRVAWVILAAIFVAGFLGAPALLGARLSPLRLAAGIDVVPISELKDSD